MSRTTLFLIIDAGRNDYVRPDAMPYLHGLAQEGLRGSFISPPGFAQRTAFFTGRYPDTSGNLSAFVFDPENSPFQWVSRFGRMANVVKPYKVFVPARWGIRRATKWFSDCYHTDPAWIPPRYLPFFRPCEDSRPVHDPRALGAPSIFDLARANDVPYAYRAHPVSGDDESIHRGLLRDLRSGARDGLTVAQFSILDQEGHIHGPDSDRIQKECLPALDHKIRELHEALTQGTKDWDLFVCADHGMATVEQRVDVQAILKRLPIEPARDYVVFVNSTLAVFWYLTERGRREIEAALPAIEGTGVVSDQERVSRRIPTDHRWGDRMLAARPGVLFWPDYFHVKDSVIRGMHGYLDKRQEQYGMAVLASSNPAIGPGTFAPRPLVDVFPTLCDLVGVSPPAGQEGASLIQEVATPAASASVGGVVYTR